MAAAAASCSLGQSTLQWQIGTVSTVERGISGCSGRGGTCADVHILLAERAGLALRIQAASRLGSGACQATTSGHHVHLDVSVRQCEGSGLCTCGTLAVAELRMAVADAIAVVRALPITPGRRLHM